MNRLPAEGRYAWAGGDELLHLTPGTNDASVVAILPLFEEANRTRALMATILRDLNARGYTTALPDLPGQGDSLVATADARLDDWRNAIAGAVAALPGRVHVVAIRSGALLDAEAAVDSRWYLSPQPGAALVRELGRMTAADGTIAGNTVAPGLLADLAEVEPAAEGTVRLLRLASDALPADRVIEAGPLWRRAEPDNDPALAALLAEDIAKWIVSCEA